MNLVEGAPNWSQVPDAWRTHGIPGRVLIAGDIMLDRYWFGDVQRISPEAPVPIVKVERTEDRLGGAANVARNVCSLGGNAVLAGVVGDDKAGEDMARLARETGLEWHVQAQPEWSTIVKMRIMGRNQQLLRIDCEQPCPSAALEPLRQTVESSLNRVSVLILSDYAKGALNQAAQLIQIARTAGVPVLVDPKGDDYERYRGAFLLTPNLREFREAVGGWRSDEAFAEKAQQLRRQLDLQALLVTRSEQGMSLFTAQGEDHIPALAHEVFDVSGAGDTVIGTLGLCLSAGLDLHHAMRWANLAGGISVGKVGTSAVDFHELFQVAGAQA